MSTETPRFDPWTSEQVITYSDDRTGLRAVIAVDDTRLGPGFGGVRWREYPSAEAAVLEAQRLARAMTFKHALAELPYGGAKSVMMAPRCEGAERVRLFEAFGEAVRRTHGLYIPGVDMGTTLADMDVIRSTGAKVYCADHDPSPWTARGAFVAMRAAVTGALGADSLAGLTVAVQGAGNVGGELARLAGRDGAKVLVADVDVDRARTVAQECGGQVVGVDEVVTAECDVLAPSAVARVVTADNVADLHCRVISGAANDVLDTPEVERLLRERGILFVPDFVANAGGVIHEHARALGWTEEALAEAVDAIGPRVGELVAAADGGSVVDAALARGRARLEAADGQEARS